MPTTRPRDRSPLTDDQLLMRTRHKKRAAGSARQSALVVLAFASWDGDLAQESRFVQVFSRPLDLRLLALWRC